MSAVDLHQRLETHKALPLKKLKILVPEGRDWILLKSARCDDKDIANIKEISKHWPIQAKILIERFTSEMLPHNPGNDQKLVAAYLYVINVLFGNDCAELYEEILKKLSSKK